MLELSINYFKLIIHYKVNNFYNHQVLNIKLNYFKIKTNLVKLKKINDKYLQDIIKNPGIELIQEKFQFDINNLLSSRSFK